MDQFTRSLNSRPRSHADADRLNHIHHPKDKRNNDHICRLDQNYKKQ